MLQQQDAGVKPPPDVSNPNGTISQNMSSKPVARPKGGSGITPTGGGASVQPADHQATQQAQRCPRCDSLNTKFCYYNNYSLSQPRHFCKNCRRYWTKGGSLRNVPVGGGCRKNKRLKHRDTNSLVASLAEVQDVAPSSLLASAINGCGSLPQLPAGFGPSASCLISELASEGHRVGMAFSHSPRNMPTPTQDFFSLGTGPFDPSFTALTYPKQHPHPQPHVMFHQPAHELSPNFFHDQLNSAQSLPPSTLDHLSTFSSSLTAPIHHANMSSIANNSTRVVDSQLSLIHQIPLPTHDETGNQLNENQQGIQFDAEDAEMSMLRSRGKPLSICSLGDWQNGPSTSTTMPSAEAFYIAPASAAPNESSIWNVSWPEMHAALAGSTTAGAMLH